MVVRGLKVYWSVSPSGIKLNKLADADYVGRPAHPADTHRKSLPILDGIVQGRRSRDAARGGHAFRSAGRTTFVGRHYPCHCATTRFDGEGRNPPRSTSRPPGGIMARRSSTADDHTADNGNGNGTGYVSVGRHGTSATLAACTHAYRTFLARQPADGPFSIAQPPLVVCDDNDGSIRPRPGRIPNIPRHGYE